MIDPDDSRSRSSHNRQIAEIFAATLVLSSLVVGGIVFLYSSWPSNGDHQPFPPSTSVEHQPISAERQPIGVEHQPISVEHQIEENIITIELERSVQFEKALALKSEKIVYCPIEKVACTEWLKVFRWVDGQEDWEQPRHMKHGLDALSRMQLTRANEIMNSPEWLKLAIVREPSERLLSCFLQKCNGWNFKNEYRNCPYLELWPDLFSRTDGDARLHPTDDTHDKIVGVFRERGWQDMFTGYVESIARRVKENPCHENPHWAPQYCHCSLDRTYPAFHIVGWANMTEVIASAVVPAASTPERGREVANFIRGRMGHNSERENKKTGSTHYVEQVYSKTTLEAVRQAYARDYELFSQYWQ